MYAEFAASEATSRLVRSYMYLNEVSAPGSFFCPAMKRTVIMITVDSEALIVSDGQRVTAPRVAVKGVFESPYLYGYDNDQFTAFGADLHPIGMYEITGCSGDTFKNDYYDATKIWSKKELDQLVVELSKDVPVEQRVVVFDAFIQQKTTAEISERSMLVEAADQLAKQHNYEWSVAAIASEMYVTEKTLRRAFLEVLGISPKRYFSLALFEEVIRQYSIEKGASLSSFQGLPFYDLSHINKWFQKYTLQNPSEFVHCDMQAIGQMLANKS